MKPASQADIVLVGCSSSKATGASRAADLFTGAAFRKGRDYAERSGRPWYVLSAKFGLLEADEVVAPYDVYLGHQSDRYRTAWGCWVVAQLSERHDLSGAVVEVHAGEAYCAPLGRPLAGAGAALTAPLAGLRQGERLAWYGSAEPPSPSRARCTPPLPDIALLLDERNAVTPGEFLAAGPRAARSPGLYTWWVDVAGAHELSAGLGHRVNAGLIYAGRAGGTRENGAVSTNTLWGRVGDMHLEGNRSFSTFRRTLAACLSHPGQPVDEAAVTAWMHRHLRVAVLSLDSAAVLSAEQELLHRADPPLNLQGRPGTPLRQALSRLRTAL